MSTELSDPPMSDDSLSAEIEAEKDEEIERQRQQIEELEKEDKKNEITYTRYKKMREEKGGPTSIRSYRFFKANGFKDKDRFLNKWRDPRPKNINHMQFNKPYPVTAEKVFNISVTGEGSCGVRF
eukprot:TCONS_00030974-protein